jgi:hypothetical protein
VRRHHLEYSSGTLKVLGILALLALFFSFAYWLDGIRAERWAKAMRDHGVNAANLPPGAK